MKRFMPLLLALIPVLIISLSSLSCSTNVILLRDKPQRVSDTFCSQLRKALSEAGYTVTEVNGASIGSRLQRETGPGSILILPDARFFPSNTRGELEGFLQRGNHLFCICGPAFSEMSAFVDGKWVGKSQMNDVLTASPKVQIFDFNKFDPAAWSRYTGSPNNETLWKADNSGRDDIPTALHVSISKLDDYEFCASPQMEKPFPDGYTVTTFWAKGGPDTPELKIEWTEKDTSRWKSVIKLAPEWKRYALIPEDFKYWGSKNAVGRGGEKDRFNPANAQAISFELANSITSQEMGIAHKYWVSDIYAAKDIFSGIDFDSPLLESISPAYKTYTTTASAIRGRSWTDSIPNGLQLVCPISSYGGLGANAVRKWRHIPLIRGLDSSGVIMGDAAHLFLNTKTRYTGSVWGYIDLPPTYLEQTKRAIPAILYMLQRMSKGLFIANAGSQHFGYYDGEQVKLGAYIINTADRPYNGAVEFTITCGDKHINTLTSDMAAPARALKDIVSISAGPLNLPPGEYTVRTRLNIGKETVDEVAHSFTVAKYEPLTQNDTVCVDKGQFHLGGKPWRGLGVNYWPRYTTGQEPDNGSLQWLLPEHYNPEMIERDLVLAKEIGINLLSIQYMKTEQARCLIDFMARAHKHGFKVNVYVHGLHPLEQNINLAKDMILAARIPESPAMFAYDIGWEVHVGEYGYRNKHNYAWENWVIERYGSIENAVRDWGFKPEQVDGVLSGPTDDQVKNDGQWRVFVAAYRRFWDDEISKQYKSIKEFIRSLDSHHLVSARSGLGGNGIPEFVHKFPFDLASGAKHFDFISPEAYASKPERSEFLRNGFTTLYGRFVSGGKPVYWSEFGKSVISIAGEPASMDMQYTFYKNLIEMFLISNVNASAAWWWPGGLRVDEKADYGIINPDGTLRPSAAEIKKNAKDLLAPISFKEPNVHFTLDRDKWVGGYAGIYAEHSRAYVEAIDNGQVPGLQTEATGKTSADVSIIAVGNVPYNGSNPPKHLNAEFNYVKVNGKQVKDGEEIVVGRGKPIVVEASIGNIAEAKWIASREHKVGAIYLVAESQSGSQLAPIIQDTPFLADAITEPMELPGAESPMTYNLRMTAKDRANFGEVFTIKLRPI